MSGDGEPKFDVPEGAGAEDSAPRARTSTPPRPPSSLPPRASGPPRPTPSVRPQQDSASPEAGLSGASGPQASSPPPRDAPSLDAPPRPAPSAPPRPEMRSAPPEPIVEAGDPGREPPAGEAEEDFQSVKIQAMRVIAIGFDDEQEAPLPGALDSEVSESDIEDETLAVKPSGYSEPEAEDEVFEEIQVDSEPSPEVLREPSGPEVTFEETNASLEDLQAFEDAGVPLSDTPSRPPPPKRVVKKPPPRRRMPSAPLPPSVRRKPWWEELFGEDFARSLKPLPPLQIQRETNFIAQSLGLSDGGVVLDLCCGQGQHAVSLAERGYAVVGYDLSVYQLAIASDNAQRRKQKINFLQGDMREMAFEETFDGMICWDTSFGYFEEEKNVNVAERMFRALRPGGRLLLDVINRDFAAAESPNHVWFEGEGCVCMDDMSVDWITSRLRVKRSLILDDGRSRECTYSVRLYGLHELGKLLHDVGFRVTQASGDFTMPGVFFGPHSPRIIIRAEKP